MAAAPFANLVTMGAEGLDATPLPLMFDPSDGPQGSLIGHIARANPQWRTADVGQEALAIFSGPDSYITPSYYETKRLTGRSCRPGTTSRSMRAAPDQLLPRGRTLARPCPAPDGAA